MPQGSLLIFNGTALRGGQEYQNCAVLIDHGRIIAISTDGVPPGEPLRTVDARGNYIAPGFIDTHIHGFAGYDFMVEPLNAVDRVSRVLPQTGVTAFVASISGGAATMRGVLNQLVSGPDPVRVEGDEDVPRLRGAVAQLVGVHLEGPFLSPAFAGALERTSFLSPKDAAAQGFLDHLLVWQRRSLELPVMVTCAPELEGAPRLIQDLTAAGVLVAMGHSGAESSEAAQGRAAGSSHVTHLFNAMKGWHHREPGLAGLCLATAGMSCEIIVDGIHLHPDTVKVIVGAKSLADILLVTDATALAGQPNGTRATLGGSTPIFRAGDRAVLADGTMAGSTLTMSEALSNLARFTGLSAADAVLLAAENPARVLGIDGFKGRLEVGMDADIVILNRDLEVLQTFVKGELAYDAPGSDGR